MLAHRTLGVLAMAIAGAAACSGNGTGGTIGFKNDTGGGGSGAGATTGSGAGATTGSGAGATTGSGAGTTTGAGAGPGSCTVFPGDNAWNKDISGEPVDPLSDTYIASMGATTHLHPDFGSIYGIPYQYVNNAVSKSPVIFDYADESDPGPYPIPANPVIEDGGDAHLLMIHTDECVLYEIYAASNQADGWHGGSGAIWDLKKNSTRPVCWTSADAAGLPIFPGLARYEEAAKGAINHALRFTASKTQSAFVDPASHFAGSAGASLPPMGLRVRLKKTYDFSAATPQSKIVLTALQKYGMILADNGSNWFVSGAPDMGWDDDDLGYIKGIPGSAFEAVKTGPLTTASGCP
jgi:hypothetical protein